MRGEIVDILSAYCYQVYETAVSAYDISLAIAGSRLCRSISGMDGFLLLLTPVKAENYKVGSDESV
jgi:hypothetical protein